MNAYTKTQRRMTMDACTKTQIAIATARFARKADGRLTTNEAAKLGRLYGADSHWRFLRTSGDKLAQRSPGSFATAWARYLGTTFKSERRAPHRYASTTHNGAEIARHLGFFFGWLGPNSQLWPGDELVLSAPRADGLANGWRVMCASDCPCGKCYRPFAPITMAVADAHPSLNHESAAEYYARVTAAISRSGLAKTLERSASDAALVLKRVLRGQLATL